MTTSRSSSRPHGFTLVELMVVIVIVSVLAALAFSLSKRALRSANSARDMSTMRQMFQTFPLYASDNNGYLPGPLYTGVKAEYRPQASGRLANFIAPYLGYENPKVDEFLPLMAFTWQKTQASREANSSYLRAELPLRGDEDETIMPYGHPQRADRDPKKYSAVLGRIDAARTWAMSDLDQQHPDIGNPSWKNEIPEEMSHGTFRLAIYFDGHAGKLDKDNNPK